ncbi:MAG TPA: Spy/CpxP family protein refolding chaperone [Desulfuromonadales bacterium]|nr:Spy/CpxP family protein refolding chaperone [Desulfuromonadales bacterium]
MKTASKTAAVLFALMAAVSVTPLKSFAMPGGDGPPSAKHFKQMAAELGLSDQQKLDVKALFAKNRPLAEPLMASLNTERRALRALVQADAVDETAIRAQSAKVAALMADLAVQRAHVAQQIRTVLTPEQVKKFKEIQARRDSTMDAAGHGAKRMMPGN